MKYKIADDWFEKRLKSVKPYNSGQERELLLLNDDTPFVEILEIISDIKPLNEYDAAALLMKAREISVSDLIEATQACTHCDFINPVQIEIEEFFNLTKKYEFPVGIFSEVEDIINNKRANEIILRDYNRIKINLMNQSEEVFKPIVTRNCKRCGKDFDVIINPKSIISKTDASSIFREYLDLSYYTSNSKLDIDAMLPYEREMYLNILKDKIKEENKLKEG